MKTQLTTKIHSLILLSYSLDHRFVVTAVLATLVH